MKRALCKVIIPSAVIGIWLLTCYPVCKKINGFDYFLYWVLAGFPFGIHRMYLWLMPKNFDIGGSMGVLALDCIIGGLMGGAVLLFKIVSIAMELIRIVAGHFCTKSLKVEL